MKLRRFLPGTAAWRFGLLFVLLFASCSQAEPRIVRAVISLVYYQNQTGIQEAYSFFVLPEDDDGIKDLDTLYLYHDREELVWTLGSEDWISEDADGKAWIGSRGISMNDGPLPRGQFRTVLEDKSGSRGERTFAFDGAALNRPFPVFTITDGQFHIESSYPAHSLLWYDENGESAGSSPLNSLDGTIGDLAPPESRSAALWAEDIGHYTSALTQALPLY
ncbi:MAG: hypothetical protein LBI85_02525 [Spirochaetaceae bacterium]|jgi:hypothetical protein|nr:hypothetical protein [Spirochaetaceae bacterium]